MAADAPRDPRLGWLLIVLGAIGIVTGVIPFSAMPGLLPGDPQPASSADRPEGLGLSLEWYILSSALSAYLGCLLIWAGSGWVRGRRWAAMATWVYVSCGVVVNATDLAIFLIAARPSAARTMMLVADGLCLLVPVALAAWLSARRSAVAVSGPDGTGTGQP